MSVGSTPDPRINDPAIQARARAEYQKRLQTDPSLQNKSETQAVNEIAAKYVADEAARDPNFAVSFNKGALGDLEDLGDVTAAEEHDATAIMRAGESVKPELPAGQDDAAMQKAQQADTKALSDAQAALASLQKQGLPKEVLDQYAAQVATLEKQVKQKWSGQPKPEAERNLDLVKQSYQEAFGREPDVGGQAYHLKRVEQMRAAGMDDKAIAAQLKQDAEHSEEYRLLHGQPADANKGYQQWQAPASGTQPANDAKAAGGTQAAWSAKPTGKGTPTPTNPVSDSDRAGDAQHMHDATKQAIHQLNHSPEPDNPNQAAYQRKQDEAALAQARAALDAVMDGGGDATTARKQYDAVLAAFNRKYGTSAPQPQPKTPGRHNQAE